MGFVAYETKFDNQDGYMVMQIRNDGRMAVEQWVPNIDFLKEENKQVDIVSSEEYQRIKREALQIADNMRKNKIDEITEQLEAGIKDLFESEKFKEFLKVMSRFHNYSFQNSMLIAMQCPNATHVAGYNAWKEKFGRNVKKGEKGIKIFAPAPYKVNREQPILDSKGNVIKDKDGKTVSEIVEVKIPAYKLTTVFDISQTEGKELPKLATELKKDVEGYNEFYRALKQTSPVPIQIIPISGTTHGFYNLVDKNISIKKGMSEEQTIKTCIHEITHAILHDRENGLEKDNKPDRMTKEVQAEATAYCVCQHFGIDSSDYSFGYIAGWSSGKELNELKASMDVIRKTASNMIDSIELNLKKEREYQKEQEQKKSNSKQYTNNNYTKTNNFKTYKKTYKKHHVH